MVKERTGPHRVRVRYYRAGSAGSRLQPPDVDAAAVANARILHLTGITPALSASARETVLEAVAPARSSGTVASVDLNYRQALPSLKRQEAIIQSMTKKERAKPDILNGSRRKRIAAGAGVEVSDVNKLVKMHRQMADMMKRVGKLGPRGFGMGGMPQLPSGFMPGGRH